MDKIMITGATGKLGGATIDYLLDIEGVAPDRIMALVRDPSKAEHLSEKGIELRVAAYDDPEALKTAFQNVNKLLFISSAELDNAKRLDQHHHVVMAAQSAQVDHIFYVGLANPESRTYGLEDVELATEHSIRAVNLPFTFLRNGTYLDEIAPDLNAAVQHGELRSSTKGKGFNYVLRKDLARINAIVLTGEGHQGQTYELDRSEWITFAQIASVLSNILEKEIPYVESPSEVTIEKLVKSGVKVEAAESLVHVFHKAIADEKFQTTSDDLNRLLNNQQTTLEESIKSLLN